VQNRYFLEVFLHFDMHILPQVNSSGQVLGLGLELDLESGLGLSLRVRAQG